MEERLENFNNRERRLQKFGPNTSLSNQRSFNNGDVSCESNIQDAQSQQKAHLNFHRPTTHRPECVLLIEATTGIDEEQMVNTGLLRVTKVQQNHYDDELQQKLDDLSNDWRIHTNKRKSQKSLTSTQQMV